MPLSPSTTDELIVEEQDRIAAYTESPGAPECDQQTDVERAFGQAGRGEQRRSHTLHRVDRGSKGFCSGLDLQAAGRDGIGSNEDRRRRASQCLICATHRSTYCGTSTRRLSALSTARLGVWQDADVAV